VLVVDSIYPCLRFNKDGKDLDIAACNEYLTSISDFCKYIPASDNEVQMPTGNQDGVHEYTYFNLNGVA
jgi:hypothetical protein